MTIISDVTSPAHCSQTPPTTPRAIVLMIVISLPLSLSLTIYQKRISFPHITRTYCTLGKESVQTRIINSVNHLTGFSLMTLEENRSSLLFCFSICKHGIHWIDMCNNDIWHKFFSPIIYDQIQYFEIIYILKYDENMKIRTFKIQTYIG